MKRILLPDLGDVADAFSDSVEANKASDACIITTGYDNLKEAALKKNLCFDKRAVNTALIYFGKQFLSLCNSHGFEHGDEIYEVEELVENAEKELTKFEQ